MEQSNDREEQGLWFMEKGKYHDLLGTNLLLENSNLDSLGGVRIVRIFRNVILNHINWK